MFRYLAAIFMFEAYKENEGTIWTWITGALIVWFLQVQFGLLTWLRWLFNAD
jgi:hypothetical protein